MHVLRLAVPVHHEAPIGLLHVHLLTVSSSERGVNIFSPSEIGVQPARPAQRSMSVWIRENCVDKGGEK